MGTDELYFRRNKTFYVPNGLGLNLGSVIFYSHVMEVFFVDCRRKVGWLTVMRSELEMTCNSICQDKSICTLDDNERMRTDEKRFSIFVF